MNHFVITRFNIDIVNEPKYINTIANKKRSVEWFKYRAEICNRICVKTLEKQTKPFTWLMLFNEDTLADQISLLKGNFIPIFGTKFTIKDNVKNYINNKVSRNSTIITTNVDSDDGISSRFLEFIQKSISCVPSVIYVSNGYKVNLMNNTTIGVTTSNCPFVSVIEENNENITTCFFASHGEYKNMYKTFILDKSLPAYFLISLNETNIINRLHKKSQDKLQKFEKIADLFGLDNKDFPCDLKEDSKGFVICN
jgi:hypothetical protein